MGEEDADPDAVEVEANPHEAGLRSRISVRKEEPLPLEEAEADFKAEEDVVMVDSFRSVVVPLSMDCWRGR